MGRALHDADAAARAVFAEADEALGFSLSKLCFEGPEEELTLTANAQPAILATSIAALRVLRGAHGRRGPSPSPGTRSASTARSWPRARCRSPTRSGWCTCAASSCRRRSRRAWARWPRSSACPPDEVAAVCREAAGGEVVSPANLNGGGQVVIAGHKAAVERACAAAKARGAKRAKPLAVSAPFHCALMQPAADRLAARAGARGDRGARGAGGDQRRGGAQPGRRRACASCWRGR